MSHLSDKDIDHLAREAAEQLDVDQNSSGWEALQAKLDVEMPVEKRRRRWLFLLLFPLLGGGFFLAYKLHQSPDANSLAKQSTTKQSENSKAIPGETTKVENSINPQTKVIDKSTTGPLSNQADVTGDKQQVGDPVDLSVNNERSSGNTETNGLAGKSTSKISGKDKSINPKSNKHVVGISSTAIVSKSGNRPSANNPAKTESGEVTTNDNDKDLSSDPSTSSVNDSLRSSTATAVTTTDSSDSSSTTASKDSAIAASPANKTQKKKSGNTLMPEKGFVFGIIAGPDVSKVNGTGTDQRGFNAGILGGYRFNGRLSLISGVNYTHKYYTAKGADYKPAKGTWLDTVSLSKVVGECFMFEVPVNVRYDLLASKRNYAFASAGLSSYFMQQEDYDFHYTTNSGYYNSRYKSYKVSDQYWFSVLNLSAGYERMVTKRLSLQVEPYIKLPLNGIGFGNMDLSSYGVFFGARYHTGTLKAR